MTSKPAAPCPSAYAGDAIDLRVDEQLVRPVVRVPLRQGDRAGHHVLHRVSGMRMGPLRAVANVPTGRCGRVVQSAE